MSNPLVVRTPETSCKKEKDTPGATCTKEALRCKKDTGWHRKTIISRTSTIPGVLRHRSKPPMQGPLIKHQDRTENNAVSLRAR